MIIWVKVMKSFLSYLFIFNITLFSMVACEGIDNSSGFYSGDSLATKNTNQTEDLTVQQDMQLEVEESEVTASMVKENSEIAEEELDYK